MQIRRLRLYRRLVNFGTQLYTLYLYLLRPLDATTNLQPWWRYEEKEKGNGTARLLHLKSICIVQSTLTVIVSAVGCLLIYSLCLDLPALFTPEELYHHSRLSRRHLLFLQPLLFCRLTFFPSVFSSVRKTINRRERAWIYLAGVGGSNCDWIRATVQGDKKCSFPARWLCVRVWAHVWHSNLCGLISVLHTNGVYIELGRCCTFKLS